MGNSRRVYLYRYEGVVQATLAPVDYLVAPDHFHPFGIGLSEEEAVRNLKAACKRVYEEVAAL